MECALNPEFYILSALLGCVGAVDIAVKSYDSASRSSLCLRVQGEELMIHTRLCVISIAIYIYIAEKDFIAMK